jgi:hypothetical protein
MSTAEQLQGEVEKKGLFISGHSRAQWVTVLLLIVILIDVLAVIFDFSQIQLLSRVQAGIPVSEAEAVANDSRQALMGFIYFAAFIVAAIAFCLWIHRSHRNLPALGARDLKYSPAWAVGGFFVPILSLYRPYQVTKEIWKASAPNVGPDWQGAPTSPLIGWWWVTFIVSSYAGYLLLRMTLSAETISDFMSLYVMTLVIDIVDIPVAILAIMLVRTIDQRQTMKNQQMLYASNPQNELRRG